MGCGRPFILTGAGWGAEVGGRSAWELVAEEKDTDLPLNGS